MKIFVILLLMLAFAVHADDEILRFDRSLSDSFLLSFPNEDKIQVDISEFEVLNYAGLSSENGERFAVVTLKNTASGNRTLTQKHILGLFADGKRMKPLIFSKNFKGNESLTINIGFGKYNFPLVNLYTRNNL